jgi:hypothetical protein
MNVKSAPITTFCLALALVFYSFDLRQNEWTAAATAALPEGLVLKLPGLLCSCCLLLACSFFLLFERYNGTHNLCSPQAVASLPLWSELNAVRTCTSPPSPPARCDLTPRNACGVMGVLMYVRVQGE